MEYTKGRLVYANKLASEKDTADFVLEGAAKISFDEGAMRMQNNLDPALGQKSNFVYWCNQDFSDNIEISWQFRPVQEPGLCIMFFAAKGRNGEDLFSPTLAKRTGEYDLYHSGDINCLHVSYYRRMWESERCFHTCNLRKSHGFHLVCQGADPLPDVADSKGFYDIRLVKRGREVGFWIEDLLIFHWLDDGESFGDVLGGGKIGFRQMAPFVGEYKNLAVHEVV